MMSTGSRRLSADASNEGLEGEAMILKAIKQAVGWRAIFHLESHAAGWLPRITRKRSGKIERLFWQSAGGYGRNLVEPQVLWAAMDYLHLNPGDRSPSEEGVASSRGGWGWSAVR